MSNPYSPEQYPTPPQQTGQMPPQVTGQFSTPNYYQPQPALPNHDTSVGSWVLTIFLTSIPIVGLVMLFVWAFGSAASPAKANWAKATLLWMLIGIGISVLMVILSGGAILGLLSLTANS